MEWQASAMEGAFIVQLYIQHSDEFLLLSSLRRFYSIIIGTRIWNRVREREFI